MDYQTKRSTREVLHVSEETVAVNDMSLTKELAEIKRSKISIKPVKLYEPDSIESVELYNPMTAFNGTNYNVKVNGISFPFVVLKDVKINSVTKIASDGNEEYNYGYIGEIENQLDNLIAPMQECYPEICHEMAVYAGSQDVSWKSKKGAPVQIDLNDGSEKDFVNSSVDALRVLMQVCYVYKNDRTGRTHLGWKCIKVWHVGRDEVDLTGLNDSFEKALKEQ